ncbi:Exosome complex RNA-binding protein Csl4 [Pseudomonas syringae pv. actinidiae]|uniref:Exosome complex RNA-binding protein Csl4 n=1 Tax=Pseudomonas syringae pv. actinidiae TaxID=103796 RepID=A0A2V0QH77_PSESF|nr:Exosome complex RNA-binding protein Csl4 [Pseudomonas syringae pv. actinidiae]
MPARITPVHRVSLTIRIRIQASTPKWAQAVRAIEPHQHRIESSIAVTQQIMPGHGVRALAVETGKGAALLPMTIRAIGQRLSLLPAHSFQHTALHVGAQQVHPEDRSIHP